METKIEWNDEVKGHELTVSFLSGSDISLYAQPGKELTSKNLVLIELALKRANQDGFITGLAYSDPRSKATEKDIALSIAKDKQVTKLIEAAKEIAYLAEKNEARSKAWQELAIDSRKPEIDRREIERRRVALDASKVVDFGTAIDKLRHILKVGKF
jgi:hypothetical protein